MAMVSKKFCDIRDKRSFSSKDFPISFALVEVILALTICTLKKRQQNSVLTGFDHLRSIARLHGNETNPG